MEEVIHQFDKYFVEFIYKIRSQTYFKISHIVQEFFPFFHVHSGLSAPCVFFLNVCLTGFSFDHHRCFFHTPPEINMELPKLVLWVDVSPFPRGVFSGSICFHVSFLGVYSSRWLMDNDFGVCFFFFFPGSVATWQEINKLICHQTFISVSARSFEIHVVISESL